ncbi:MAG: DNA repair protein RadC [Armatimonadetes bacterium ATM1]|nr:MAG: DNA repair protein RadC [Armatimonadota bacterium]MBC6968479.1 DNA repair protein RadC [Armatimonadota bacterium]MCE7898682.1 DNA repair protein RadC [Armatimonadetes bacterium ATM1]RIJ98403.1 MAG: hypothetical protein DCC45_01155 [Armatimonadota bacterium]
MNLFIEMCRELAERLRERGPGALSTVELIGLALCDDDTPIEEALNVGAAVAKAVGNIRDMHQVSPTTLADLGFADSAKCARFLATVELGRRTCDRGRGLATEITGPADVAAMFEDLRTLKQEHFCVLLVDAKNRPIKRWTVHIGTLTMSVVGPREVFREAVREGACGIFAVHNHPSGDPTPSSEDYEVTGMLCEAGKVLDVPLIDHIIIGERDHTSLRSLGAIR